MNNDLWLFDYNQGVAYEAFSQSEDASKAIERYFSDNYGFKDKVILEIGAGSGKFTSFLAKACSKLYVVEKSASLMQINYDKNSDTENVEFILSDARELTMKLDSVDIIFAGWSLTSMREFLDTLCDMFKTILRKDGLVLLVENAGNDEFCKIMDIEDFTSEMENIYAQMGILPKKIDETVIKLPHEDVFRNAFPSKQDMKLQSLEIKHKVLILEMQASVLQSQKT